MFGDVVLIRLVLFFLIHAALFSFSVIQLDARASITPKELRFENGTGMDANTFGATPTGGVTLKTKLVLSDDRVVDEFATSSSVVGTTQTYLDSMVGMIAAHVVAPPSNLGWIACDGRTLLKSQYPKLYAAIGDIWSVTTNGYTLPADPAVQFKVPDLRARFLMGVNPAQIMPLRDPISGVYNSVPMTGGQRYWNSTPRHAHPYGNHSDTQHRVTTPVYSWSHSHSFNGWEHRATSVAPGGGSYSPPIFIPGLSTPTYGNVTFSHPASDHAVDASGSTITAVDTGNTEVRPPNFTVLYYIFAGYPSQ